MIHISYFGKLKKFQINIRMRLGAMIIIISASGGYQIPPSNKVKDLQESKIS